MNKPLFRKYWSPVLLGVLLIIVLFALPRAVSSQTATANIYIDPDDSSTYTCETHQIDVMIEDVVDLTAYHLEISFDPSVVEVLSVVNGTLLGEPEDIDYFYEPSNEIDNINGLISFGMAQQEVHLNPLVEPQSGTGSLVVITLKALVPNDSTVFSIDTEESTLVNWPDAFTIDYTTQDGIVQTKNCLPTADPQTVTTSINTPINITLSGSDLDNDPLTYFLQDFPEHGSFSGGPMPDITYTPNPGFIGTDTFTFTVYDGYDFSLPATVTIHVEAGPMDILLSNNTIAEGEPPGTLVGVLTTVSEHPTATYGYTLVAGEGDDDNGSFEIVYNPSTGDFELRSTVEFDSTVKNEYTIRVRSTDENDPTLFVEKIFIIKVLPVGFGYYLPVFFR